MNTLLWKTSEDGTETAVAHGFEYIVSPQCFYLNFGNAQIIDHAFTDDFRLEPYKVIDTYKAIAQSHANHIASLLASKAKATLPELEQARQSNEGDE